MQLRKVLSRATRLLGPRNRRVSVGARRAHVEFRVLDEEEVTVFAATLQRLCEGLRYLEWAEVNVHTRRVVFAYEQNAFGSDDLIEVVERAERLAGFVNAKFGEDRSHPGDGELELRRLVEVCFDAASFVAAMGLTLSPVPAIPFSGNFAGLLSLLRGYPRLRAGLERRLGVERAEFVLNLTSSLVQAIAQRPSTALVEGSHKLALLREVRAAREVWTAREEELSANSPGGKVGFVSKDPRPVPFPQGPIEQYGDKAWAVSLSGFALSFLTTRSFQRATAALFGGLPGPARMGRDVFAAEVACGLSARNILVLQADALRCLDRIDCLVIQGDLLAREQFVVGGIKCEDPDEATDVRERVLRMFDVDHPLAEQEEALWRLRPWGRSDANADVGLLHYASERQIGGALMLSLERAGRVVAMVEVDIIPRTGVDEVIAAAHEAQMRVVIASGDEATLERYNADDIITSAEGLRSGIRRLQREGHAVALVATGNSPGFAYCDLGIGLCRPGEPTPWGAELVCREDLADVQYVARAAHVGRAVSRQAVNIALGAASLGALVSAGGLLKLTTQRVLFVVNTASLMSMANGFRAATKVRRLNLPSPRDTTPWHALTVDGVVSRLNSTRQGLSRTNVVRRPVRQLPLPNRYAQLMEAVSDELFNPLAPLLAAGAGLSAVVGSTADATMVASVVVLNALVGGVQRFRVERKISELTRAERRSARVRRDQGEHLIDADDLVIGDVIVLGPGDVVPADCRIIDATSLEVDASTLTGESLPVRKGAESSFEAQVADRSSMLFDGTAIAAGRAEAIVVAVGDATEARRGLSSVRQRKALGGVEQRLRSLMDLTGPVALAAGIGVVGGGLLRGRPMDELVSSGVSLAVASVPEGLPLLATAAQLAAAQRLAARNALVRNGRSIEALGRVDVICLDKTGTLTEGHIQLKAVSDGDEMEVVQQVSRTRRHVLAAALRASPDRGLRIEHDPTDSALFDGASGIAISEQFGAKGYRRMNELSFESGRGYHATLGSSSDSSERATAPVSEKYVLSIKGAPEVLLPLCERWQREDSMAELTGETRFKLAVQVSRLGRQGLRVLAVAERELNDAPTSLDESQIEKFVFLGFVVFADPIRETARAALSGLATAGVRAVMVTGDHPSTAEAIATDLGLLGSRRVLAGAQLADLDDVELEQQLGEIGVFARVTPAQKVRIVRAFQRKGSVVAMVGDGANDAPAIRLAEVGVAIGKHSTAAARGVADIVLVDGRIETLVEAIKEGRAMWASVRDAVSILIGGNLGEIGFTTAVGLLSGRPPLNARQLLLVNLLTDVAPAMAIALRPPSRSTLDDLAVGGPDVALGQLLNRQIALRAALTAFGAGSAWTIARLTGSLPRARTAALAALVGTQLGQTLRSAGGSRKVHATGVISSAVLAAIIQTPGLSHFFGCRPMGPWGWSVAVSSSVLATYLPDVLQAIIEQMQGDAALDEQSPISILSASIKSLDASGRSEVRV
jgi:cation-transporting P-type ATPase I